MTPLHSEHDRRFRLTWDALRRDPALVVEDNADVGAFSTQLLQDLGYQTTWARSAGEAMAFLEDGTQFDVVFSDVVMPGMNGRELADAALALFPDLKLLFTTGYTRDVMADDGGLDEGVELMAKPFTFEQLAVRVRGVLDAGGP